jgi:hypothetical protein
MSVQNTLRPQCGAKAIAIDYRTQRLKLRLLLFLSLMLCTTLAQIVHMFLSR